MKYFLVAFAFLFFCTDDDMSKDYTAENEQEILDYIAHNNLDATTTGSRLYYVVDEIGNGDADWKDTLKMIDETLVPPTDYRYPFLE